MILLGYGLCSQAVVGLWADDCMPVVPAVDDCIAIARGSRGAYEAQCHIEPGTYYLTESWIGPGDSPFNEYDSLVERYRDHSRRRVERFELSHGEIPGSKTLINKMPHGPRDDGSVVGCPSETISYLDFKRTESQI